MSLFQLPWARQQEQQQQEMNPLLAALLPNDAQTLAQFGDINSQLNNLDQRDANSSGILGYFGRKSRDKKRNALMDSFYDF